MAKKLLISYFFPPRLGGVENYYLNLCSRLDPSEIVVLTQIHYQSEEFDKNQPYKIYRTDFFGGKFPPTWRQIKQTIKGIIAKEGIEEIIFGHFHPLCLLGASFGLPYFIFGHGTDITQIKNSWWQKHSLRKAYKHSQCRKFIANSNFLADQLFALVGDRSKMEVIYPGIDFKLLNGEVFDFASKKQLMGLDDNDIILLSMGRIEPEKNLEAVIRLMPEMMQKIPNLKYVIVGDGSDLERLKGIAVNQGLKYQVIFTGPVTTDSNAKSFYYQLGHIFVTASFKPEGFGISYIEAQATKTPVIASKFGGSAEAVKDGETGILVDPNFPAEIAKAVYELAENRDLWEKMSTAGVAWAKGFDWELQLEKIKKTIG